MNLSTQPTEQTARTSPQLALQRAENLAILGVRSVLELCVGPSLGALEAAYARYGIRVVGNDIDSRWRSYHPTGKWVIGDARDCMTGGFDAVVVAPPLSRGCSGRREDSLSLEEVSPSYYEFLHLRNRVVVYVLPGRTLSVQQDREQLHRFLKAIPRHSDLFPLQERTRNITKYLDVYVT